MKLSPQLQQLYQRIPPGEKAAADRLVKKYDNSLTALSMVAFAFDSCCGQKRKDALSEPLYESVVSIAINMAVAQRDVKFTARDQKAK